MFLEFKKFITQCTSQVATFLITVFAFNDYEEREKNNGIVLCNTHIPPLDVQKTDVNRN